MILVCSYFRVSSDVGVVSAYIKTFGLANDKTSSSVQEAAVVVH